MVTDNTVQTYLDHWDAAGFAMVGIHHPNPEEQNAEVDLVCNGKEIQNHEVKEINSQLLNSGDNYLQYLWSAHKQNTENMCTSHWLTGCRDDFTQLK